MFVRSEEYTVADTSFLQQLLATRAVLVQFSAVNTYTGDTWDEWIATGYETPEPSTGLAPLSWSGRNFSFTLDWTNPQDDHHVFTITGSVSADGRTLTEVDAYDMRSFQGGWHIETTQLKLKNLPHDEDYNIVPNDGFDYGIDGSDARNLLVEMTRSISHHPEYGPNYDYDYISTNWYTGNPYIYVQFFR